MQELPQPTICCFALMQKRKEHLHISRLYVTNLH
jgi:hypothetical protein